MIRLIDDWRTSHKKATVIFCAFMGVLAQYYTDVLSLAYHELPIIAQYIDKSHCIPLPSSEVHDYWACKKEIKKLSA